MLRWFRSHGELLRVGVESTGTYGAGITRHLALSGIPVLEVTGPDPASRRAKGKDDALDAISAAEAARTRRRVQVAKDRSGSVEALRVLRTTRKTAIKCRRAALQQLYNTIVAAPEEVRDQVRNLTRMQRLRTLDQRQVGAKILVQNHHAHDDSAWQIALSAERQHLVGPRLNVGNALDGTHSTA